MKTISASRRGLVLIAAVWIIFAAPIRRGACASLTQTAAHERGDIAGVWQGTLQTPRQKRRMVLKVTKLNNSGWAAVCYSIDQDGTAIACTVSLQGTTFRFAVPSINGTYEGQLSADGNSVAGTWTQAAPLALALVRATKDTAWEIPSAAPPPKLMAANADTSFEVATIKPTKPDVPGGGGFHTDGRNFSTIHTTLSVMVQWAYGVQARQIAGGPDWIATDRYDIAAIFPEGAGVPNVEQMQAMLAKLLTERFKLSFHHEKREMPAFVLEVAKSGAKLVSSESAMADYSLHVGNLPCGRTMIAKHATTLNLAGFLQRNLVDRPVLDHTDLTGKYDFTLKWTPDNAQAQPPSADNALPGLFEAIQQQLGLKLDPVKAPVDVLVIDKAEKPSEN